MRALLFEPSHAGHRLNYVRLMVPALYAAGCDRVFWATTDRALASEEYRALVKPLVRGPEVHRVDALAEGGLRRALQSAGLLAAAVRALRPDWVYVPYADGLALGVTLRAWSGLQSIGSVPLEGLILRGGFAYPTLTGREKVRYELIRELSHRYPWKQLHQLDPWVDEALSAKSRRALGLVMPDPVEPLHVSSRLAARHLWGLDPEDRVLGTMGALDVRKGVHLLVEAFVRTAPRPGERLLLAGKVDGAVKAVLEKHAASVRSGRIVVIDRWLSQEELDAAIGAVDWVTATYPRHIGSASLVLRAAAAGRRVVASNFGWIGRMMATMPLGISCDVSNPEELTAALRRALDDVAPLDPTPRIRRWLAFNSPENFQLTWTHALRAELGQSSSGRISWESVLHA